MSNLADLVPVPVGINPGLSACRQDSMIEKFGIPGALTDTCSAVTGTFKSRIKYGQDVGPFKVTGLDYAIESLTQVLAAVAKTQPDVVSELKTAGMLCVRCIKNNPSKYSNHSWGTAIDLYFGEGVVPQGRGPTQRGFVLIYEAFNQHGWFWGAGFSGDSIDTMHFELADQSVKAMTDPSLSQDGLTAAAGYIQAMGYDTVMENT